jgi:hypothetical protein
MQRGMFKTPLAVVLSSSAPYRVPLTTSISHGPTNPSAPSYAASCPVRRRPRLEPALTWARRAAAVDEARFAYADAAGHLARACRAVGDAGLSLSSADLIDLLTAEADARLRAGDAEAAHDLLEVAWEPAVASGETERMGAVALGLDRIGARFAMPRGDLVAVLERTREAAAGSGTLVDPPGRSRPDARCHDGRASA